MRKIVPIDSPVFGRVMAVCVGAMMVGSIKTTVAEGEEVKRGQEFGYFAFGMSLCVSILFFADVACRRVHYRASVRERERRVGRGSAHKWAGVSGDAGPSWYGYWAQSPASFTIANANLI